MRRSTRLLVALVFAFGCLGITSWAQEAPAAIEVDEVRVVEAADGSYQIGLRGTAPLPDGAILLAVVEYRDTSGLPKTLEVRGGVFDDLLGVVRARVIPGSYTVRVSFRPQDQHDEILAEVGDRAPAEAAKVVTIGDPANEGAAVEEVRKRLYGILTEIRRVYMTLAQWGHYYQHTARLALLRNQGELPPAAKGAILAQWQRYTDEYWKEIHERSRLEFQRFQEDVFLAPFPKAVEDIGNLYSGVDRWYALVVADLYRLLEEPLPAGLRSPGPFKESEVRASLLAMAAGVAAALGDPEMDWNLVDLAQPEDGTLDGETYKSKVSKFQVAKPGPEWFYDFAGLDPMVRMRIRPLKPEDRQRAVMAVEIKDFAEAENEADLRRMLLISNQERWPGFRKVSEKPLQIPDDSMPKGIRPGHEIVFTTTEEKQTFKMRTYELFCRWNKRTYAVLCITPKDEYAAFEEVFDQVTKSFMVLDAPPIDEKSKDGGEGE